MSQEDSSATVTQQENNNFQRKYFNGKERFCTAPFLKFETLIDSTVAPCCSIWTDKRLGNIETQTFDEIWNSKHAIEMRESIHDGSFRFCNKDRCSYIINNTLPKRDEISDEYMQEIIEKKITTVEKNPSWIFLAHDLTCNLACPSCRDCVIGEKESEKPKFEKISQNVLEPIYASENEIMISLSGQGDPFSSQHYRKILRKLSERNRKTKIDINTNALLLTKEMWDKYIELEKHELSVNISIDACKPWTYGYLRQPGDWKKLKQNLLFIGGKRKENVFKEFFINATIQLDNFHEIGDLSELVKEIGADSFRAYNIQMTGGHLAKDFSHKNIADSNHPLYLAYLETLRDKRLEKDTMLYDVALFRDASFNAELPSDQYLNAEMSESEILAVSLNLFDMRQYVESLCIAIAARIRFPFSMMSRVYEGIALIELGYKKQATYRYLELLETAPYFLSAKIKLMLLYDEFQDIEKRDAMVKEILSDSSLSAGLRCQIIEKFVLV